MTAKPRTVLGDLADWELPALDDEMEKLIALLQQRKITVVLDEHCLRQAVYDQLWEQVRAAGAAAANQAIAGWLKGGADGCPDLCVQFPYLEGDDDSRPLTIAYSVGAEDGSRMELRSVDLEEALREAVDRIDKPESRLRAHSVAARLRALADCVEEELN